MIVFLFPIMLLVFLYGVFVMSKDDYLLIRKNVSPETMFSFTILSSLVSVFFGRLVYILEHPNALFWSPIAFLAFPYHPGFSGFGALVGFVFGVIILRRIEKVPGNRVVDILGVAAAFAFAVTAVLRFASKIPFEHQVTWAILISGGVAFVLWLMLWRIFSNNKHQDGIVGVWTILFTSMALLPEEVMNFSLKPLHITIEGIALIVVALLSVILLVLRRPLFAHA